MEQMESVIAELRDLQSYYAIREDEARLASDDQRSEVAEYWRTKYDTIDEVIKIIQERILGIN